MSAERFAHYLSDARFFHYTAGPKLQAILEAGELRPSNAGAPNERPLLWFSSNPRWEPTATKMVATQRGVRHLSMAEQRTLFGCVRFELGAPLVPLLLPWAEACRAAGTSRDDRRALERSGKRLGGNPDQWFAYPEPIPLADCMAVERMDDAGQWVSLALQRMDDAGQWVPVELQHIEVPA